MLQAYVVQASRAAAATFAPASSSASLLASRNPFHTSATLSVESARKRQARLTRQKNLAKREELQKKAAAARPHVVLGTVTSRSGSADADAKWASCDLARVLVRPEELRPDTPSQRISLPVDDGGSAGAAGAATAVEGVVGVGVGTAEVRVPPSLAFGMRERERSMVFEHLPLLSADMGTRREMNALRRVKAEEMAAFHEGALVDGVEQANVMAALVDLRNANAAGIAFENRRRVIEAFSEPGKPNDTGRTEVQAALLTLQIRNLWKHLSNFKRDIVNRRSLRRLVHQRAKLLKYLKRTDRDRYERVLERLGLEPGAVEGELVV